MVIEVEGEEARDGDEGRVIVVEEVIVLDERTRGRGMSGGRKMECSKRKGSVRSGPKGISGDAMREEPVGSH